MALVAAFTPESTGRRAAQGSGARIVAGISAGEATAGAVQMREFTTELTLDGDAIALNRLGFEMFGGRYEGSVTARVGAPLSATLESRIADLDVAQLATFGGVTGHDHRTTERGRNVYGLGRGRDAAAA